MLRLTARQGVPLYYISTNYAVTPLSTAEIFTGSQAQFQSATFPSWMAGYAPSRFAAVVSAGSRSGVGTDINDAARDRIGNVYVDDETGTPDFSTLRAFWRTEVSDVLPRREH